MVKSNDAKLLNKRRASRHMSTSGSSRKGIHLVTILVRPSDLETNGITNDTPLKDGYTNTVTAGQSTYHFQNTQGLHVARLKGRFRPFRPSSNQHP